LGSLIYLEVYAQSIQKFSFFLKHQEQPFDALINTLFWPNVELLTAKTGVTYSTNCT
jgi:hypothetical protein